MHFIQNFPFFCIFLSCLCGIACLLPGNRTAKNLTIGCLSLLIIMSLVLLMYTMENGESFTYLMGHFPNPFVNEIRAGPLEALFALFFCIIGLLSLCGGINEMEEQVPVDKISYYYLVLNILMASVLSLVYSNDFFTAFVFIEILTIASCIIIVIKPGGATLLATIIYLVMSLISSCLILFSIAMIYGISGHLLMPNLQQIIIGLALEGIYTLPLFVFSGLLFTGLAIKCAIFPFHGWLPNAYTSSLSSSSSIMSGIISKCYILFVFKIIYRVLSPGVLESIKLQHMFLFLGGAGIVYGSYMAIKAKNIKRMLSYASIVQVGSLGIAIGINTEAVAAAAFFHMMVHAAAKAMLFTAAGGLSQVSGDTGSYSIRGAGRRDPLSAAAFIIAVFSIIGIPPFPGFFSKLFFTQAVLESPHAIPAIAFVVVISTALSAMYFFPAIGIMLSKTSESVTENLTASAPLLYRIVMVSFIVIMALFTFFSGPILDISERGLALFG